MKILITNDLSNAMEKQPKDITDVKVWFLEDDLKT